MLSVNDRGTRRFRPLWSALVLATASAIGLLVLILLILRVLVLAF
jgi:hypothetical protein